jgi:hypothetical protein
LISEVSTAESILPVSERSTVSEVTNWNALSESSRRNSTASSSLRLLEKFCVFRYDGVA